MPIQLKKRKEWERYEKQNNNGSFVSGCIFFDGGM